MTILPETTRPAECLSDFRLDGLLLGGLPTEDKLVVEQHVADCARCTKRVVELRADAASFDVPLLGKKPETANVVPIGKGRRAQWAGAATTVLALAAALFLFFRGKGEEAREDGIRMKGAAHVGFFVEHEGRVRRGFPGERVQPGDKLQFAVATHEPAYVAVLSIDGAKVANVYYASMARLGPTVGAAEEPLPVSILLDDVLGEEQIWGLVCTKPRAEDELRGRLQREGIHFFHPADCVSTAFSITKIARAP